jgi:hypothetical protein
MMLDICVIRGAMKKLFFGCLIFITACQTAAPTPAASPFPTATLRPTPVPATVTPQPTASQTLEPSPTPFPRFFTDDFDSSLAGWVTLQTGNDSPPIINIDNSRLLLQMDSPYTWVYAVHGAQDYADIRIDAQFENRAGSPSSVGLICRYGEIDGWLEYNVSTEGTYNVLYGRWLTVGIADYLPILDGASDEIGPGGAARQIGLICSGTKLQLFINEKLVRSVDVSRYGPAEGKIGITASSYENTPVLVAFDRVKVSAP